MKNHTCRVLLVEDESSETLLFTEGMKRAGVPWSLRVASGRTEAVEAMTRAAPAQDNQTWHEPDFVVLDLRLRGTSGFHVLRWIRTHLKERMIPVVIFTSSVEPGIAEQAQEYGATTFVQKPGNLEGVIKVIVHLHETFCGKKLSRCTEENSTAV